MQDNNLRGNLNPINIPAGWESKYFGDIFDFLKTFSFTRDELTEEKTLNELMCIHYGDIHATYENEILDLEIEKRIPYLKDEVFNKNLNEKDSLPLLRDGDLVIADASEDYTGIAECIELKNVNEQKLISGLHTIAARDKTNETALGFRTYLLTNPIIKKEIKRVGQGISVYSISRNHLSKIKLMLPSLKEQEILSDLFSKWDEAIFLTQKLISTKEQLKKGLMQQLLTGKKRLPGFNGEWKKVRIGELVKEVKRPIDWDENKLYDLISVRRRSGGVFFRESLYGHQILTKGLFTAKSGDFLISKMQIVHGASGSVKKSHDNMYISGSYIALHSKDDNKLDIEFFDWVSKTPEFYHLCYTSSYGVHIEKMTFDFNDFLHRQISIPTEINEQKKIVSILNTLVNEIDLLKSQLELYRQQKKGLMQVLLTGKKRIRLL